MALHITICWQEKSFSETPLAIKSNYSIEFSRLLRLSATIANAFVFRISPPNFLQIYKTFAISPNL